jgi:outer membrane protein assembly factor BamB
MNKEDKIKLTRDLIVIAGIFSVFTAILLFINFMQMTRNEPLESEALKTLVLRLAEDPDDDALKNDIRNLDLLARKAYFTAQWQVKTGGLLLLCGSVVLAAAIWYNRKILSTIEKPEVQVQDSTLARMLSRKWLLLSGALLFVIGIASAFLSNDYLQDYNPNPVVSAESIQPSVKTIQISRDEDLGEDNNISTSGVAAVGSSDEVSQNTMQTEKAVQETDTKVSSLASQKLSFTILKNQHNAFRGPFSQGIVYSKNIPVDWDGPTGKNILWKTPVPKSGFNSPVIWNDKIFLSGADEQMREVYCFDRLSGKLLWSRPVTNIVGSPASPPRVTDDTGLAAPTLTVDFNGVYAIFGTGDLIAFDHEGNRLWARNLGVPDNHYGHSSSLQTWDDKVFIQYDTNRGSRLIAVNTRDGNTVWEISRTNRISWASPVLAEINGKLQILTTSEPTVAGHNSADGSLLWKVDCMMGEVGPSVAFSDGLVFAANEYATLAAIKPGAAPELIWEDNEYLPEAASPVAFEGLLYLATSYGVIACYDAATGEKQWEHEAGNGFYSSPVIADGRLYLGDLSGTFYVFKASREKNLLAIPKLGENAYATPAFTQGRIYIRGEKHLICIGIK